MDYGTLLVVSPNEEIITSLTKDVFQPLRIEPIVTSDGRVGLEKALLFSPSAILLDETLPAFSEFLIALRQSDCISPVILLTTDQKCEHLVEAFRKGISDFIFFPIDAKKAQDTLQTILKLGCEQADREKLNQKLLTAEAIQITIATLSHYANNYLTAVSGNLTLLQEMVKQGAKKSRLQETILDSQNNIQSINTVVQVLLNTTNILYTNYDNSIPIINIEDALAKELKHQEQGKEKG